MNRFRTYAGHLADVFPGPELDDRALRHLTTENHGTDGQRWSHPRDWDANLASAVNTVAVRAEDALGLAVPSGHLKTAYAAGREPSTRWLDAYWAALP